MVFGAYASNDQKLLFYIFLKIYTDEQGGPLWFEQIEVYIFFVRTEG